MVTRNQVSLIALVLATLVMLPLWLSAQGTTGTISGIVHDSSGAVVPGAEVVITNTDTGNIRTIKADDQGRYLMPNLAIGNYTVQASSEGFQKELRTGLQLTVGQQAVIHFTLNPGSVSESVTIMESAPLVDTSSAAVGTLVNREQIRDLPLNGRDFTQLALLQPGVVKYREQSVELNRGLGTRFSISGARHNQVSFRLNGLDISDGAGTTPGSATGHSLGVDAIQEFQVLTNTFGAEYGKAAGGVLNVVHKSGTNSLHGSLFEYLRNSVLDSPGYFDKGTVPPFKRNQFGGSVGGPIIRDRAFFFTNIEELRERLAVNGTNTVLSAAAKNGAIAPVNPLMKPYLDVIPLPNSTVLSNGTGLRDITAATRSTEHYFVVKGDYSLSSSDSLSGSYTLDDGQFGGPSPRDGIVMSELLSDNKYHYVTLVNTHIFSPSVLNNLRFGLNRSNIISNRYPLIDVPANLLLVPGTSGFSFEATGIDGLQFVVEPLLDRQMFLHSYQFADSLLVNRGSHSFKIGFEFQHQQFSYGTSSRTYGGRYAFSTIPNLLSATASSFQADDPESEPIPYIDQNLYGMYIQDDIRLTPHLTINAGLRYEFIGLPTSTRPNQSTLIRLEDPALVTGTTFMKNPSLKNFAPRVGFAWDVFGNQRTAVRGGAGIYHDQISTYYYLPVIQSNPPMNLTRTLAQSALGTTPFPSAFQAIRSGTSPATFALQLLDYNLKQPYRIQYNMGIQQELTRNLGFAVYYVGAHAVHSTQFTLNANSRIPTVRGDGRLFFAAGGPVRNPNFGVMQYRTAGGDSYYNAFQTVVNQRLSSGLQFQGSYTWSKSTDTGSVFSYSSEGLNTVVMQSLFDPNRGEKGLSSFDARHVFSASLTYDLPEMADWNGAVKALAGGWQVGGILNLATGHPFTPILGNDNARVATRSRGDHLRPDLVNGANNNPTSGSSVGCTLGTRTIAAGTELGRPELYYDPCSFMVPEAGVLGNLGRNTMIGPGYAQFDFTAKKKFHLSESNFFEFRAEMFNLFNRANFRIPEDTQRVFNNANAGLITGTTTSARQIQFSLRYEF